MTSTNILHDTLKQEHSHAVAHFMSRVYLWMFLGLMISAFVAYSLYQSPAALAIAKIPGVFFAIIGFQLFSVLLLTWLNSRINAVMAVLAYIFYATLTGVTFSLILLFYAQQTIFYVFALTAGIFFLLSVFAYITKKDLSPLGTFAYMGVFGIIMASLLSLFVPSLRSDMTQWVLSGVGVIAFSLLTAYDTQRIKRSYLSSLSMAQYPLSSEVVTKSTIQGALSLYLDFVNLFIYLLRIFSDK